MWAHSVSHTVPGGFDWGPLQASQRVKGQLLCFPPLLGPPSSPEQSGEAATAFGLRARSPGGALGKLPSQRLLPHLFPVPCPSLSIFQRLRLR